MSIAEYLARPYQNNPQAALPIHSEGEQVVEGHSSDQEDLIFQEVKQNPKFKRLKRFREESILIEEPRAKRTKTTPVNNLCLYAIPRHKEVHVIGREGEVEKLLGLIEAGIRPLLIGPHGIGKKALMRAVAFKLNQKAVKVILIDCVKLLAKVVRQRELYHEYDFRKDLKKWSQDSSEVLFYFKDIDRLTSDENSSVYLDALLREKKLFAASLSGFEKEETIGTIMDQLADFNFQKFTVTNLSEKSLCQAIARKIKKKTPLKITENTIPTLVKLLHRFFPNQSQLTKSLQLLNELNYHFNYPKKITEKEVASYISEQVKIPVEDLLANDFEYIQNLKKRLKEKILFQEEAIDQVCDVIESAKYEFSENNKPRGVFLFIGSTGVGKTELAKSIAKEICNDEQAFIRIDMSEYSEEHTKSRLIGSPPGYVGYESGGLLTNAILQKPHSVVLLDEIEEAHEVVLTLFLQLMDEGFLTDAKGRVVDCRKTYLIMTSNIGAKALYQSSAKGAIPDEVEKLLQESLTTKFRNRIQHVVPFNSIAEENKKEAFVGLLKRYAQYLGHKNIHLKWKPSVINFLAKQKCDLSLGMRELMRILSAQVYPSLIEAVNAQKSQLKGDVLLTVDDDRIVVTN